MCRNSFFEYYKEKAVDIRVVRIFNTYGPNMNKKDSRVISNFFVQALSGDNMTDNGMGTKPDRFVM